MDSAPKFSVIIPTFNRAALVLKAVGSVLTQTYPPHELIVVDDGSTDDTAQRVERYLSDRTTNPVPVRYVYQSNQGKSVALNCGIAMATGDWIAFLDSDDLWTPEKLARQTQAISRFGSQCGACFTDGSYMNNPDLTMTDFERGGMRFDTETGLLANAAQFLLRPPHVVRIPSLVVRTIILEKIGDFDSKLRIYEDTDFVLRLSRTTELCFVNLPLVKIDRTMNRPVGLIELFSKEDFRLQQLQYMYEKWLSLDWGRLPSVKEQIVGLLQEIHNEWANWYLINQDYNKARQSIARAVDLKLTVNVALKWILIEFAPALARQQITRRASARARKGLPL